MKNVARTQTKVFVVLARIAIAGVFVLLANGVALGQNKGFQIEEMSISVLHRAIQNGETTCRQVVQAYIDRAKAYNGMCTALVTPDGAKIAPVTGAIRAGSPIKFP